MGIHCTVAFYKYDIQFKGTCLWIYVIAVFPYNFGVQSII